MATIQVKLKNGETVPMSHPDDWSTEQVEQAIHESFPEEDSQASEIAPIPAMHSQEEPTAPAEPKQTTGWKGLKEDALNLLKDTLKGGIGFGRRAPGNIGNIVSDIASDPLHEIPRANKQILAGLGEGAKDLLNIPHRLFDEFADKEITPDWLRTGKIPEDLGIEKALGLEAEKPSDELLRAIPALYGGGKLIGGKLNKTLGLSKDELFQQALKKRIQEAGDKTNISKTELKDFQNALRRDYSDIHQEKLTDPTPTGQYEAINVKKGKIDKLKADTEIPVEEVGEIPEAPDTDAITAEKISALNKAREEAESVVGIKGNPRSEGAAKVKKVIEDLKSKATELYTAARKHYADKNVVVDNSAELKSLGKEVEELSANEGIFDGTTSELEDLQSKMKSLQNETVKASDLFDLQRSFETMAKTARNKQYSSKEGMTQIDRDRFESISNKLYNRAAQLEKQLESVGGKEVQQIMKEANKGWRTFKDLEKRNPIGKGALKGELPIRTMVELTNNHPGNDFLSALVESDPELKKLVLASYTGETNLNKLLSPNDLTKKYLKDLPEVDEHVHALKEALKGVETGKSTVKEVTNTHKDLVKSMTEAAERQKTRMHAITETKKLEKQNKFHEEAIPKLEKKISQIDKDSAAHAKLKKELAEHKQAITNNQSLIKKYAPTILKVLGANQLINKKWF